MTQSGKGVWQPLLEGAEAEHARSLVLVYSRACISAALRGDRFDLANGALGASLLIGELERCGLAQGLPTSDEALGIAGRQQMHAGRVSTGLWHGTAGFEWAQCQLTGHVLPRAGERALVRWVSQQGSFDLINGVVGVGVLALELGEAGEVLVNAVVKRLRALSRANEHGVGWPSRRGSASESYDLGLAHGHAGAIAFLAGAAGRHDGARDLLAAAAQSLVAQARPSPSPWAFAHVQGHAASRLAWCYGDPGIAVALARAAAVLATEEIAAAARDVAVRAARRLGDPSVKDASLCHGSGGLAHVFARLWQYTGENTCADAARFWMKHMLQCRSRDGLQLPFPSAQRQGHATHFRDDAGLVTGGTGVCLALLTATETREPRWDRCMLLSA